MTLFGPVAPYGKVADFFEGVITTDSDLVMQHLQNGSRHDSQQPRAEPLGKRGIVHFPYAPSWI